jgi:predicted alpha/beta superfamily hydrolase
MRSTVRHALVLVCIAAASPLACRAADSRAIAARGGDHGIAIGPGVVGDLRLHELTSRVFENRRTLRVLVPRGYDAPENRDRRYPVLYLNDGQNLFDSATSTFNPMEWRVDESVDSLVAAGAIPPLIVVGIDNAGRGGRFHEYFPYVDAYLTPPDPDPQGRRYPEFLVDEVIPFIESRYRTMPGPAMRGLGGSSAGALAALYTAVARPGMFGRLLIESPSIYVDDARILREAESVGEWPARLYVGAGTNEGGQPECPTDAPDEPELVADVRRLERVLAGAGVHPTRIHVEITPCGEHHEGAWAARLPTALSFLYGERR